MKVLAQNYIKFVIVLMCMTGLYSCSTDYMAYDVELKDGIYFTSDSLNYQFGMQKGEDFVYDITVRVLGTPKDHNRVFEVELVADETTAKEENGCVEIETSYSISSPALQRILAGVIKWTIYSDGTTDVHVEAKKDPVFPVLPRFGLRLFLPESFAKLTYCGLGPVESYVDKHQASYHGVFHSTPAEQQEDYIRPQENGSHYDCDYASLASDRAVLTAVGEKTFSFQASIYTQEELTAKAHNYELRPCGSTVFCIDYRQAGIGSASCGPMLLEKYQLKETEISFDVRLKPELL